MTRSIDREFLLGADAAGRLVEEQRRGVSGHGEADVEELALPLRQFGGGAVAHAGKTDMGEKRIGFGDPLARPQRPEHEDGLSVIRAGERDHHIVADRQCREKLRHLERAPHAEPGHRARRQPGDIRALEQDVRRYPA